MHTFKYIIKRILIGTGIALALMFIKGNLLYQVHAKDISSVNNPFTTSNINVVNNNTATSDFDISGGNWANWGLGTLRFNFSIIKVSGSATDPIVIPSGITANSGGSAYACNVSSNSTNNSTWTGNSYTANCSMKMGASGLTKITIYLTPNQQNTTSTYRITIAPVITYEQDDNTTINVDTSSTTNAINNQTQTITNNQTQNTQDIINSQNQNTQDIKNELSDCTSNLLNSSTIVQQDITGGSGAYRMITSQVLYLQPGTYTVSTNMTSSYNWGIQIQNIGVPPLSSWPSSFVYETGWLSAGTTSRTFTINTAGWFNLMFRNANNSAFTTTDVSNIKGFHYMLQKGSSATDYIPFGEQICGVNKIDKVNDSINSVNNTLNNSDTDDAQEQIDSDFNDFDIETHGLTLVIGAPIRLFRSLLTNQCTSLTIPLPFVNQNIVLPCMSTIYTQHFGDFLILYRLITDGVIGYWVCIKTFKKVKDFLNPIDEKVEVFDL